MSFDKKYDLCVAGGGFAGVGAALRAAKLGIKTILIEKNLHLGGSAHEGMHEFLCGLYASGTSEPKILNTGFSAEIERKLISDGFAKIVKMGKVWALEYQPQNLQKLFREWIQAEKNLEVFYESTVDQVLVENQKIKQINIRNQAGYFLIKPRAVIDCTGSGDIVRLSGASYEIAPAGRRQLAAYAFQIEGVENPDRIENLKTAYYLIKAADSGKIAPHLRFTVWLPGQSVLRMSVLPSDSGYDLQKIHAQAELVHQVLKDTMPEFRHSKIGHAAAHVVERESLRMCGLYTLTEENVLKADKFQDGVVKSAWPVEFWDQVNGPRYQYLEDGQHYEIPARCFQSKDISNLFAAGKCISADPKALSSARMSGTCLAMGERSADTGFAYLKSPGSHGRLNIVDVIKRENEKDRRQTALRQGSRRISYQELFETTDQLAGILKKSVKEYGRVGIFVREGMDYVVLNLAVLSLQAVIIPIPETSSQNEIERIMASMKLDLLIFDLSLYGTREGAFFFSSPLEGMAWGILHYNPEMEEQDEFESLNPAFVRFTSGTTGESKGVVISHETILARTDAADQALKISHEDTVLWVLSMAFHFIVTILLFLRRSAAIVLCGHEIPKGMIEGLSSWEITFMYASPVHYQMALYAAEIHPSFFEKVRMAVSTTMPLQAQLAGQFLEKFGVELTSAYGIIEAGLPFVNVSSELEHRQSVGVALPGYQCRLTDQDSDGVGIVHIKGPGMFDAYFSPWRKKEQILRDGWFETGDIGRLDAKGFLFLLGRRQRIINFMGMKIFPEEIESGLREYPGIQEVYVDGEPHEIYGYVPRVKIVLKNHEEKINEDDLRRFCYQRFSRYKVPKSFEYVSYLKKTASGKIMADQAI